MSLFSGLRNNGVKGPPAVPNVLILTPVKDAADCLKGYFERIGRLTYPHRSLSLGFLESDSRDATYPNILSRLPALNREFRAAQLWKRDYGFQLPPGIHRAAMAVQLQRRSILAKSRNQLLFRALGDEDWVLWLDVDVIEYPDNIIETLLACGRDIVQPHCVLDYGGPTFDRNGWRDQGELHLDDLREGGEFEELHAVGGTMLLVRADLHRDGLIFPPFLYGRRNPRIRGEDRGELETEGLGIMANDMGVRCWGMPRLEILHRRW
jgi:hypothetical protein